MYSKKSLSAALAFLFLSVLCMEGALAQNQTSVSSTPTPQYFQDCKDKMPKDPEAQGINLGEPYPNQETLNFRIAFEKMRTQYHMFVECVFEKAVEGMLGSAGGDTDGIFSAHAPNLPEWSKPTSACLSESALTQTLNHGSPETLIDPLLKTYNAYVSGMRGLFQEFSGRVTASAQNFEQILAQSQSLQQLVENETQDALIALNGAFTALKDMRQAFVMHVHFQCMLKNLEFYRRAMENFRRVVSGLPATIVDASMHKQ